MTDDLTLCVTELQCLALWGVIVSRMTCYDGEEHCSESIQIHTHTHTHTPSPLCVFFCLYYCPASYWFPERKKGSRRDWMSISLKERKQAGKRHRSKAKIWKMRSCIKVWGRFFFSMTFTVFLNGCVHQGRTSSMRFKFLQDSGFMFHLQQKYPSERISLSTEVQLKG